MKDQMPGRTGETADIRRELEEKEQGLQERLRRLDELEKETREREKALKEREKAKKQVLLRLSPALWEELAAWAEDDFRSINSQIEYLLSACVRERKKKRQ